jgi:hypothetical protein
MDEGGKAELNKQTVSDLMSSLLKSKGYGQ